jgi:uncharacterized protein YciI
MHRRCSRSSFWAACAGAGERGKLSPNLFMAKGIRVDFVSYTIALLMLRADAPVMSEDEQAALQDAHMQHLASLHDAGALLAAGPILGPPDRELRGFSIYRGDPEDARVIADADPAVRAGTYRHELHLWMLPTGLVNFTPGRLPRSMADAQDS